MAAINRTRFVARSVLSSKVYLAGRLQFTDIKDIKEEMFKRLKVHFENWLNP